MAFDSLTVLSSYTPPPSFKRGSLLPVVVYLSLLTVLSALTVLTPGESPPPLVGMAWGVFLVALTVGAFKLEAVSPRRILPPIRTVVSAGGVVVAFWLLYNLVGFGLGVGGAVGVEATWSRVAAHPVAYLAAFLSSLLFTAIPEEVVFRTYLQQKFIGRAGGNTRRAVVTGIGIASVLFALFHLPRWFLALGHGVGTALAVRLLGLTVTGATFGLVYAITGNLWVPVFFHATLNQPPLLVTINPPLELHFVVGVIESAVIVAVVYVAVRLTEPKRTNLIWSQSDNSSASSGG